MFATVLVIHSMQRSALLRETWNTGIIGRGGITLPFIANRIQYTMIRILYRINTPSCQMGMFSPLRQDVSATGAGTSVIAQNKDGGFDYEKLDAGRLEVFSR